MSEYEQMLEMQLRFAEEEKQQAIAMAYEQGRADERAKVLDEVNAIIKTRLIDNLALDNATKYGNTSAKQQANSYASVMKYEIADCVDDLLDDLEELKEQK